MLMVLVHSRRRLRLAEAKAGADRRAAERLADAEAEERSRPIVGAQAAAQPVAKKAAPAGQP